MKRFVNFKVSRLSESGSCNFCNQRSGPVLVITTSGGHNNIEERCCRDCWPEVKQSIEDAAFMAKGLSF